MQSEETTTDRRPDGTFLPGHRFSKGNKANRRVAELRSAMLDAVDENALRSVVAKLLELAREGDTAAARLVLEHTIGKPRQAVELSGPDGGPLADWGAFREAILAALDGFPDAKLAVALSLRRVAAEVRLDDEGGD